MPAAPLNLFNSFVPNLALGGMNLNSDTLKVMLTNVAPVATNTVKANITEIAAEHGYSAGGSAVASSAYVVTANVGKLTGSNVVFTASGGTFGPFRYAVLYDDTATGDPLIGWMDFGSSITPASASGDSFSVQWDSVGGILTVQVGV
jgi:hypothetical protein